MMCVCMLFCVSILCVLLRRSVSLQACACIRLYITHTHMHFVLATQTRSYTCAWMQTDRQRRPDGHIVLLAFNQEPSDKPCRCTCNVCTYNTVHPGERVCLCMLRVCLTRALRYITVWLNPRRNLHCFFRDFSRGSRLRRTSSGSIGHSVKAVL